jgi:hypothetical protein
MTMSLYKSIAKDLVQEVEAAGDDLDAVKSAFAKADANAAAHFKKATVDAAKDKAKAAIAELEAKIDLLKKG